MVIEYHIINSNYNIPTLLLRLNMLYIGRNDNVKKHKLVGKGVHKIML